MTSFVGRVKELVSGRGRNEYNPVQIEEEETERRRVSITGERYMDSPDSEAAVGLLSEEPGQSQAGSADEDLDRPSWKKGEQGGLCVCCGVDFALACKALGYVALILFLIGSYALLKWAFYEPPVGLERLPEFGTSLGCHNTPYLYNNTKQTLSVPMGSEEYDHGIDIRGGAVGTITLAQGHADSKTVLYEVTLRSNNQGFLQSSMVVLPQLDASGNTDKSIVVVASPYLPTDKPDLCIRYDVKMFIPPSLKKLHVTSHTLTHVQFDPHSRIRLEDLFVTLYTGNANNIIQTASSVKSDRMSLEVYRGWIVGDVSIVDETTIMTQRGDGVAHVDVYPAAPKDRRNPQVAVLETTTGSGRTDVFYHANEGVKRPIESTHISSKNGDMAFTYKNAKFSGLVDLEARRFNATGLGSLDSVTSSEEEARWTHYAGSKDGRDRVVVKSRGWVGFYV